ncbi:hypothetical protein EON83_00810 [bacterium]|nr:MAG: hypothetical protein EON83_00810 [bacterium]
MTQKVKEFWGTASILALPLFDFFFIVYLVYIALVPHLVSPYIAVPLGCILAVIALAVFILPQGSGSFEIQVGAFILLVVLLFLYPTARRGPKADRAKRHEVAVKRTMRQVSIKVPIIVQNLQKCVDNGQRVPLSVKNVK